MRLPSSQGARSHHWGVGHVLHHNSHATADDRSWLLSIVPFIVTSAAGGALLTDLPVKSATITLVISFICWSVGIIVTHLILAVYLYRPVSCSLPVRETIVSCFIPIGPTGMGGYAIQLLARGLSSTLRSTQFTFDLPTAGYNAGMLDAMAVHTVAESVLWLGVSVGLALVAEATFWFVFAFAAFLIKTPRGFNVGFWSFVFPNGVYALALGELAANLRNEGFKGYAATVSTQVILLWLGCALGTLYKGVWRAQLFFAPGLEGWHERLALREMGTEERMGDLVRGAGEQRVLSGGGGGNDVTGNLSNNAHKDDVDGYIISAGQISEARGP